MKKKPNNIILTGFRATGKTPVGKIVAEQLGYTFLDTDVELCRQLGASIAEVVARHGWSCFRQAEAELLVRLSLLTRQVIATGGGAVEHQQQWQKLRQGNFVVWLDADVATIQSRLASDPVTANQRPALLSARDTAENEIVVLVQRRAPLYAAGSDMRLETDGVSPAHLAARILEALTALNDNAGGHNTIAECSALIG